MNDLFWVRIWLIISGIGFLALMVCLGMILHYLGKARKITESMEPHLNQASLLLEEAQLRLKMSQRARRTAAPNGTPKQDPLQPGESYDYTKIYSNIQSRQHIVPVDKKVQCPSCKWVGTERELSATWDWAGPHCPNCGQTGFEMLEAVTGPIVNGRGKFEADMRRFLKLRD